MQDSPGTQFGRYVLLEELSRGGMGRVYRAQMHGGPGFAKEVAVKRLLRTVSTDADFIARFADEARIACSLSHANIVQVFDFGKIGDEYYLTMELVDGVDLSRLIDAANSEGATLPTAAALFIVASLCRGLGAAHRRCDASGSPAPVVHRDVSPHNALVSRGGDVKVTDFGIATAAERAIRTRTGLVVGKCRYLSPEQVLGQPVDARADVFACGCVLFETLTGRPLFDQATPKEAFSVLAHGPLPSFEDACSKAPGALREVFAKALRRDPGERYPNAASMAREVEGVLRAVSPAFSSDDLAQVVQRWIPSAPAADSAANQLGVAPTLPSPRPGAVTAAGSATPAAAEAPPFASDANDAGDAKDASDAKDAKDAPPPNLHVATTHLLGESGHDAVESGAGGSLVGSASNVRLDYPELGIRPMRVSRRHSVVICLGLALAGAVAGALAGGRQSTSAPAALARGREVRHGGWTIALRKFEIVRHAKTEGARLLLRLDISHPTHRLPESAQAFRLHGVAHSVGPPVWWHWSSETQLLLLFSLSGVPPAEQLLVSFDPPGTQKRALFALPALSSAGQL